jgi:hypothetical protein
MFDDLKMVLLGAVGSILGIYIVQLSRSGWRLGRKARARQSAKWQAKVDAWRSGNIKCRQELISEYLFTALAWLIGGNCISLLALFPHPLERGPAHFIMYVESLRYFFFGVAGVVYITAVWTVRNFYRLFDKGRTDEAKE